MLINITADVTEDMSRGSRGPTLTSTDGQSSVGLVLAPASNPAAQQAQWQLFSRAVPSSANVLIIEYLNQADPPLYKWYDQDKAARTALITVGKTPVRRGSGRSASTYGSSVADRVETRNDPRDVTGVFLLMDKYFNRWSESRRPTVVLVISLSTLINKVNAKAAARFVRALTDRLGELSGKVLFNLDRDAHDEQVVNVIANMSDVVLEYQDSEQWIRRG